MKIKHNHDDVSISQRWSKLKGCKKTNKQKKNPTLQWLLIPFVMLAMLTGSCFDDTLISRFSDFVSLDFSLCAKRN